MKKFTVDDSKLVRDFEPEYQLIIVPLDDYRCIYVFWAGGNRLDDYAFPSYEVHLK